MKMNGVAKIVGIGVTVIGLGVSGVWGYAKLDGKVEENVKEIVELEGEYKEEVKDVKETHKEDMRDIGGKLGTLVDLVQGQALVQGLIQKDIQYIQKNIEEIKDNSN